MAEKQEMSSGAAAPMCANGCGFYGSAANKNLCSQCFDETNRKAAIEEKATTIVPSSSSSSKAAVAPRPPVPAAGEATAAELTAEKQEEPPAPIQCVGGCGFFGSAEKNNFCSMCYIDSAKAVDGAPELLEKIKAGKAALVTAEELPVPAAEEATPAVEAPKAAPNRCHSCRKKVGLLGFACRCGGTFCSLHRYAEKHACEFDFKTADRDQIAKNNPLVVPSKIDKI